MFKFCTKCGARMPQENLFCTQCGAKFATDEQAVSRVKIVDIPAPSGGQLPKQTGEYKVRWMSLFWAGSL